MLFNTIIPPSGWNKRIVMVSCYFGLIYAAFGLQILSMDYWFFYDDKTQYRSELLQIVSTSLL